MGAYDIDRTVYTKIIVGQNTILQADIISISIEESVANDNIAIGSTNSQTLKVQFHKGNYAIQGATFEPYFSFDGNTWVAMGKYVATDCINDYGNVYTVTAYNTMAFLDDKYVPTVTAPTTASAIVQDICTQKGITFTGSLSSITVNALYEGSIRDTLGYMAGLYGKNAIFNRSGNLEFVWFTALAPSPTSAICGTAILGTAVVGNTGSGLTADNYYENELKIDSSVTITSLVSGGETEITSGTGRSIEFYNPYMTQSILDGLVSSMLPFTYQGLSVKYRGNPELKVGDIVLVESYSVPIMRQTFEYDGGLYGTIESYGLSNDKISVRQMNPTQKEIQRTVSAVTKGLESVSNSLINASGGYLELLYNNDSNGNTLRGFRIMNTPTVTGTTKGWVANINGIGWSNDGFNSIDHIGLDMANGLVYANQIVAGSILTNSFQIGNVGGNASMSFNGTTGAITFGNNVTIGWSNLPNDVASDTDAYNYGVAGATSYCSTNAVLKTQIGSDYVITETLKATNMYLESTGLSDGTSVIQLTSTNGKTSYVRPNAFVIDAPNYDIMIGGVSGTITLSDSNFGGRVIASACDLTIGTSNTSYNVNINTSLLPNVSASLSLGTASYYWNMVHTNNIHIHTTTTTSEGYCGVKKIGGVFDNGYYIQRYSGSSLRHKHDMKSLDNTWKENINKLYDIEVKRWKYNEDYLDSNDELFGKETLGIIAEDLANVIPTAVIHDGEEVDNYRDRDLLNAMLYLLQEQHKEIEDLKERLA